ncbi:MAG: hypothetical protein ACRDGV_11235 [Candidatus Limnocylindria bacterium]
MVDEPILPQRATRANAEILSVDWLFEPSWPGDRLLARLFRGRVGLTDAGGEPADRAFPDLGELLAPAILADEAVVDGVWTSQPFIGDGSPARAWADTLEREGLRGEVPDPLETERRRAFVALDLIELDGDDLYDVPFQERRRLLESVIDEGIRVRLSPVVKQPLAGWLVGWRENGFSHYVAKHMNSRYEPGTTSDDWLEIPVTAAAQPGFVARMFGQRGERTRHIRD